jgi:uncharacterized protein YdaT
MPWTKSDYPNSMKNLPKAVRDKSIEIANALLAESNMKEGIAIATAISRAKDWAANRGKSVKSTSRNSTTTDVKKHGEDRYVIPVEGNKWAIKKEKGARASKIFDSKPEAVSQARKDAKEARASLTIQRRDGRVQSRVSYNPNRRATKTR